MDNNWQHRTDQYLEKVRSANEAPGDEYWRYPTLYRNTKEYSIGNTAIVNTGVPIMLKKEKKEFILATIMVLVAAVLIYLLAKGDMGWPQILLLIVTLVIVMPRLLENREVLRIGNEGITFYKDGLTLRWDRIVLTLIAESRLETPVYVLVVHYYDETIDDFNKKEISLDGLMPADTLGATIEAFKKLHAENA